MLLTLSLVINTNSIGQSLKSDSQRKQTETTLDVLKAFHKKYGTARLILKDRSVYKWITVHEINSFWIVFIKDGSLHDMLIEKIARIQYGKEVGPVLSFDKDNKIVIGY